MFIYVNKMEVLCTMNFVLVQTYQNYIDAHIAKGQLEEAGIDCWLKDEHTVTTNPMWTNAVGGIKLMVVAHQQEAAKAALLQLLEEKRMRMACIKCGSHNVEYVSTPRKASNWLTAIGSFIFGNYAIAPDKVYHCFDCGHESEEVDVSQEDDA